MRILYFLTKSYSTSCIIHWDRLSSDKKGTQLLENQAIPKLSEDQQLICERPLAINERSDALKFNKNCKKVQVLWYLPINFTNYFVLI